MTRYAGFGLQIDADIELPGFSTGDDRLRPDVVIETGPVGPVAETATRLSEYASVAPTAAWLTTDAGDRIEVTDGKSIRVQPAPGSSDEERLVFVLASGFGALLHQRGMLPLHCGAVATAAGVIGFMGASGAGKSTITSALVNLGYALVTDDILAITFTPEATAEPAFAALKVCQDVLDFRRDRTRYEAVPSVRNKVRVPAQHFLAQPARLHHLFLLQQAECDDVSVLPPVRAADAFAVLESQTFRPRFVAAMNRRAEHFRLLTDLASQTPVSILQRPSGQISHDEVVAAVLEHIV